ncbi:MAG: RsmB/NOP family class I SAM-dependent RNA methyltransferase, partial [Lachnospiraceae bacterium]|nr:RsmB/NOP family class I SAM-dependent RNA methyltransferase [Lachnospiraceae bacterium]
YYEDDVQPAKHPYYYAGLYYIQEPSAMTPAQLLPVEAGDCVLDVCAAPGGKSTELAAKLKGKGVLVSNDISNSRAKALLKNIELMGVKNAYVVSEIPEKLVAKFAGYFDKILIDAPCSGEGMFRKEPSMVKSWEEHGVEFFEKLQKGIIDSAVKMLKPGGKILYSTCTFSPEEDEGSMKYLLSKNEDFTIERPQKVWHEFAPGHPEWVDGPEELKDCIRLWPHKLQGEGHFISLLSKQGEEGRKANFLGKKKFVMPEEAAEFFSHVTMELPLENCVQVKEKLFCLPDADIDMKGYRVLRSGLYLGDLKKNRFEPSQSLAMALKIEEYDQTVNFSSDDINVRKYLKGETLEFSDNDATGLFLICVDGFPLGWAKANKGKLKNKYHSGWRMF